MFNFLKFCSSLSEDKVFNEIIKQISKENSLDISLEHKIFELQNKVKEFTNHFLTQRKNIIDGLIEKCNGKKHKLISFLKSSGLDPEKAEELSKKIMTCSTLGQKESLIQTLKQEKSLTEDNLKSLIKEVENFNFTKFINISQNRSLYKNLPKQLGVAFEKSLDKKDLENEDLKPYIDQIKISLDEFEKANPINQWIIKNELGWDYEFNQDYWNKDLSFEPESRGINKITELLIDEFQNNPDGAIQQINSAINDSSLGTEFRNTLRQIKLSNKFKNNPEDFKRFIYELLKNNLNSDENSIYEIPEDSQGFDDQLTRAYMELNNLLDAEYQGLFRFSSKSEKEVIGIIRNDCRLNCVSSRMTLPKPKDYEGVKNNFIIDFMMYCPVLQEKDGSLSVEPKVIFVGEYYGLYKPINETKKQELLAKIKALEDKTDKTDDEKIEIEKLKKRHAMGGAYSEKTHIKMDTERFLAQSIGCDTISIFPGNPKEEVIKALDRGNIIYKINNEPGLAWRKIENNKNLIEQANKILELNKLSTYIESIKTQVRAHYFNNLLQNCGSYTSSNLSRPLEIRKCILSELQISITPDNIDNFNNIVNRYLEVKNENLKQRLQKLSELQNKPESEFSQIKEYIDNYILNYKILSVPNYNTTKVSSKLYLNNELMNGISIVESLVRLAQIADELQEVNPKATELIDEVIEDQTPNDSNNDIVPDPALFPNVEDLVESPVAETAEEYAPIETPSIETPVKPEEMIDESNEEIMAQKVMNSPEFKEKIQPKIEKGNSLNTEDYKIIKKLIHEHVKNS